MLCGNCVSSQLKTSLQGPGRQENHREPHLHCWSAQKGKRLLHPGDPDAWETPHQSPVMRLRPRGRVCAGREDDTVTRPWLKVTFLGHVSPLWTKHSCHH